MGNYTNAYSGGNKYYTDAGFVDPSSSPELINKFLDSVKTFSSINQSKPKLPVMVNGPWGIQNYQRPFGGRLAGLSGVPNRRQQKLDAYNQSVTDWYKLIDDAYSAGHDLPGHIFDLKNNASFGDQRKFSAHNFGFGMPKSDFVPVRGIRTDAFRMNKALNKINPDWSQIPIDVIRNKIQKQTERYYARKADNGPLGGLVSPFSVLGAFGTFAGIPAASAAGSIGNAAT